MRRAACCVAVLVLVAGIAGAQKTTKKNTGKHAGSSTTDAEFATTVQKMEADWVQGFNSGNAQKVADMYAPDAVLMRWDGSVHGRDSILAEMQRSISGGAHDYVVHSLRVEKSGDLAYDTGAYNVTLRTRVVEGNYLLLLRRIGNDWKIVAHASVPNPATP